MNKKIILIIVILIVIIGGIFIYRGFIREEPLDFRLEKVFRGDVYQEIVETGVIRAGEEINLSFKGMGRIEEIGVEVGDVVKPGQILAKIDDTQLLVQISEVKAALEIAEAGLARLEAGASEEEIRIAKTTVDSLERQLVDLEKSAAQRIIQANTQISSAQVVLQNDKQHLSDVKINSKRELNQAYESGLNILININLKIDNAFNVADSVQRRYFTANDQEGIRVRDHRAVIIRAREQARSYLEIVRNNPTEKNIDKALLETRQKLEVISNSLIIIREACDISIYRHLVSDISRASLNTERGHMITGITNITNAQQAIFSVRTTNQTKINAAEGQVALQERALKLAQEGLAVIESETDFRLSQIKGQLDTSRRQLELKQAQPREVDIALHRAQIDQARARKTLLERQIQESVLRSPIEGKITKITKETGEIVQPAMSVISLLPIIPFQVKVNIYEEDVAKIKMGNTVKIEIIAFPGRLLRGTVASINPTEILIGDVVHYETTIVFVGELPEGIRPGMTADIVIQAALRENVLIVFEDAIQQKDDRLIVEIYKDGVIQEREIGVGLKGEDNKVELISGLKEGEQVIIR